VTWQAFEVYGVGKSILVGGDRRPVTTCQSISGQSTCCYSDWHRKKHYMGLVLSSSQFEEIMCYFLPNEYRPDDLDNTHAISQWTGFNIRCVW